MKALVYHGPGRTGWEEVPDPVVIEPTDAVVRIDTTTICGTDLHILKGDVPAVTAGRILGHEGVGTVLEVGDSVHNVAAGDRVIISCISACGRCTYCRAGIPSHCLAGEGQRGSGGSSATSSTAPRPRWSACRSRTPPCTGCPTACRTRRPCCCRTSSRPASRSVSSTAGSSRATRSRSWEPDR
ncbi:alcohol dehydrogenase catalytic domain-containing protein [Cellulomonas sp. ATA003]|uniref:alcohol dehydrogenase catalytic domain-containing protein n=1 Tax=Cellulomonas sp. ATA003 TaxID=3073064 RepID=UPI0037BEF94D